MSTQTTPVVVLTHRQKGLVRAAILDICPRMSVVRLAETLTDADYENWLGIIGTVLAADSAILKEQRVATFLNHQGRPFNETLANTERALASRRLPRIFVRMPDGGLEEIEDVAGYIAKVDKLAKFEAELTARGEMQAAG